MPAHARGVAWAIGGLELAQPAAFDDLFEASEGGDFRYKKTGLIPSLQHYAI